MKAAGFPYDGQRGFGFDAVFHFRTTLQRKRHVQRRNRLKRNARLPCLGGKHAVKTLKRPGKAVRRVIAVFQRHIDHLRLPVSGKLLPGQCQPTAAHILPHRHAAQRSEHPLKIKGRQTGALRRFFHIQRFGQLRFQLVNGLLQADGYILHAFPSHGSDCRFSITDRDGPVPTFPARPGRTNIKRPLFQLYGKAVSFYHIFEPHQASTLDFVGSARCTLPLRRQRVHTFIRFG